MTSRDDHPDVIIRVLGPVEAVIDGTAVEIPRLQPRQVLAILAARGDVVATSELIDQLWPDTLPSNPKRALQVAVSRLRTTLGSASDIVEIIGDGMRLKECDTDLNAFRDRVAQCEGVDVHTSIGLLNDALDQWRGAPFVNAAGPPLLERLGATLETDRCNTAARLAQALYDTGEHARAAEVAQRWFDANPHDEALATVLASALAAQGRRRQALLALSLHRSTLRDTLGLDPSPRIGELERHVLTTAVDLGAARPLPRPDDDVFVGRSRELADLIETARTRGSAALVGEAGIGKTSLLVRLATELTAQDFVPLMVEVDPEPAEPIAPVAELVRSLLGMLAEFPVNERHLSAIARLVPSGEGATPSIALTREQFISALADFMVDACLELRAAIIVDDAHLLDPMSLEVLATVLRADGPPIFAASRPTPPERVADLATSVPELAVLNLPPLSAAEVEAFAKLRYRSSAHPDAERLVQQTGGNALFLNLVVALDLEGALGGTELPTSLLVAVHERLATLSTRANETLRVAAVIGRRFDPKVLEAIRPTAPADLEDAIAAGLVAVAPGTDIAEFAHGLVADAALQLVPAGRAVELHDMVGRTLQARDAPPSQFVTHYTAAASFDPIRAAEANGAAARQFARAHDVELAVSHYRTGLSILEDHHLCETPAGVELLVGLGTIERIAGMSSHAETSMQAVELAEKLGATSLLGRALIDLCSHGSTTEAGTLDREIVDRVRQTLEVDLGDDVRAELLAAASALVALTDEYEWGQAAFDEALELIADSDDPEVIGRVLAHTHLGLSRPSDAARRSEAQARLAMVSLGDADLMWEAAYLSYWQALVAADREGLDGSVSQMRELTPLALHRRTAMLHLETSYAHATGDLDTAEATAAKALEVASDLYRPSWALAHHLSFMLAIRNSQGRLEELLPFAEQIVEAEGGYANLTAAFGCVFLAAGDEGRARAGLDHFAGPGDYRALSYDIGWTGALASLAPLAAHLGTAEQIAGAYDLLIPHAGTMSWAATCTFGPVDEALATLADAAGDPDTATRHRQTAVELTSRL